MYVEQLRWMFREVLASTYPWSTLHRRLGLLTPDESDKVRVLYDEIERKLEEIDIIISSRASMEDDPWP